MNFALTRVPAALVNGAGLVSLAVNGWAQAACRYSASVSTQPMPASDCGPSSPVMCPRVAAAIALLISCAASAGRCSTGTCRTPAS